MKYAREQEMLQNWIKARVGYILISVVSTMGKVFDRLENEKLTNSYEKEDKTSNRQYSFTWSRKTAEYFDNLI